MDTLVQAGFIVSIIAYGIVLSRMVPHRLHFVANIAAAVVAVTAGLVIGLSLSDMGMGLNVVVKGIVVAVLASFVIMLGVLVVAIITPLKKFFRLPQITKPSTVAYETAVRIPLSTALSEEILFRGVLLAVLLQYQQVWASIAVTSITFGIWHIIPSLDGMLARQSGDNQLTASNKAAYVTASVIATAIAGAFFGWLRILAGSIVAPWLVHWTINSSAMLTALLLHRRDNKHDIH